MHTITNRRLGVSIVLVLSLLMALLNAARPAQAAAPWSGVTNLSENSTHGIYPDLVYDAEGVAHIVYTGTADFRSSKVYYRNNRGGVWSTPVQLFKNMAAADLPKISAAMVNGKVKLGVSIKGQAALSVVNSRILYSESLDEGATWTNPEVLTGDATFEPDVVLDHRGVPHISFTRLVNNVLQIFYTTRNASGVGWVTPVQISPINTNYNNYSTIEYTRTAAGVLIIHVLHMGTLNGTGGEMAKTVFYTRKIGSAAFTAPRTIRGSASNFADLESDHKGRLFASFQSYDNGTGFEPYFTQSVDHGANWTAPVPVGWQTAGIDARPAIGLSASGDVVVAFDSDLSNSGGDIANRYRKTGTRTWSGASWISQLGGPAKEVDVAGGLTRFSAAWHEAPQGAYQILYSWRKATPGVSGQPKIGTSEVTNNTTNLTVTFNPIFGNPNQIRYAWDTEPVTATFVAFNPTAPLTLTGAANYPQNLNPAVCSTHRLYTQLRSSVSGQTQGTFSSDTIVFDLGIQATPTIMSPFAPGAPAMSANQIAYPAGAGLPNMVRGLSYVYTLAPEPTGCAGLQSYRSLDGGATYGDPLHTNAGGTPYWVNIDPSVPSVNLVLEAAPNNYHEKAFVATLDVTDNLGNNNTIQRTLYYDDDAPVASNSTTITVDNASGANSSATLSWPLVQVTDDYSTFASGVNATNAYWGVWVLVLNSAAKDAASADGDIDAEDFAAYGAKVYSVTTNSTQTTIKLASSANPNTGTQPGQRFVYVRFLDGAGNFSAAQLETTATLAVNYIP